MALSEMAMRVFKDLYCFSDESVDDVFLRASKEFGNNEEEVNVALELQRKNVWRASTPIYMNAGTEHKMLSACWVSDINDSMDGIYDVANIARKIFQHGAGIGIPIGNLREKSAPIYEGRNEDEETAPTGKSSGPVSFMKLFDAVGATTKSGGRARRAAIMCVMPVSHPDIMEFIECKEKDGDLSNMNISVAITDKFMQALKDDTSFTLVSPSRDKEIRNINPHIIWDSIVNMSWKTADPGVLFIDRINHFNPLKKILKINATNPCITGDALVMTDKGYIPILDLLDEGIDKFQVLTFDIESKELQWEKIVGGGKTRSNTNVIEIIMDDESTLRLTPDHLIYTENRGYVKASQLKNEDIIICLDDMPQGL